MPAITTIFSTLVALEFLYIMYLETLATTSKTTARVFKLTTMELKQKNINILFKNQGIYNGVIGCLILLSLYVFPDPHWTVLLLCSCVIVALYGGLTSDAMIILKQGGLPAITLFLFVLQG